MLNRFGVSSACIVWKSAGTETGSQHCSEYILLCSAEGRNAEFLIAFILKSVFFCR